MGKGQGASAGEHANTLAIHMPSEKNPYKSMVYVTVPNVAHAKIGAFVKHTDMPIFHIAK